MCQKNLFQESGFDPAIFFQIFWNVIMHFVILLTFFRKKKVVILTMDKASKKELLSIIAQQEEDLNRYRTRFQGKALPIHMFSQCL